MKMPRMVDLLALFTLPHIYFLLSIHSRESNVSGSIFVTLRFWWTKRKFGIQFLNVKWKYLQIADILPQLRPLFIGHFFNGIWKCLQMVNLLTQLTLLLNRHIYFLLSMHGRESNIFNDKINEMRIYMFWRALNPKITFLAVGLRMFLRVCVCVSSA